MARFHPSLTLLALVGALSAGCAAEGANEDTSRADADLSASQYRNPVIPMSALPPGAKSQGVEDTEGCPDPMGLKTKSGDFYIFCTSYTWASERYDGMPIYRSATLGGNHWQRVGSLVPDTGPSRKSWPTWIKDASGSKRGFFWAPDVHQLPNGKWVALYAAPCGSHQCVGTAWAESPAGPWTHRMETPLVTSANNGPGFATDTYDGNLLVGDEGIFMYWVVGGSGIWGAKMTAKSTGEIELASAPVHLAHHGEGAYMIEREGAFYLFSSTGSLYDSYNLSVRRAAGPLTPHLETCTANADCDTGVCESGLCEGRPVLERSKDANGAPVKDRAFVATGGNSVIQDAVGGKDFMVYHGIVVPEGDDTCPRPDPTNRSITWKRDASDPYCRVQGDRQAMIDPITWVTDARGAWPTVRNGTPSTGVEMLP